LAGTAVGNALDLAPVARIVAARAPFSEGDVIGALQELQEAYGYLPREAVDEMARLSGVPVAKLYGVATFYAQFYLQPHGKHTVRLCRGTACHVRSAPQVLSAVSRHLGIDDGQTTEDMQFSLETVACLGACALSPVMVIDGQYHGKVTSQRAVAILQRMSQEERS
jgi:NADH-quinone oxidoreductase subunit E